MHKILKFFKSRKYLSHTYDYDIDGENLPKESKKVKKSKIIAGATVGFMAILIINYVIISLLNIIKGLSQLDNLLDIENLNIEGAFSILNAFSFSVPKVFYLIYILLFFVISFWVYTKWGYGTEVEIAYGQKGDSRFTTLVELKEQYMEIPHTAKTYEDINSFEGVGGVPISHHKYSYFIDRDTVNNLILGISRSGKGELTITPMIDILSRAEIKSSMVLNDPKGELYASSKDTLEARGYDVQVLNIQDPLQSMSYNPLQLVIDAWLEGNREEASKRANSIAFTLYNNPNAGENAFFNDSAQSAVVAIILAIVEYCVDNNQVEKITMGNVVNMLNDLGSYNWVVAENGVAKEKNALDEYFKGLPSGHVSKKRYGATSFAGDRTRGSILATANDGLQPFVDPSFAKMTSASSIDLKQVGFSKYIYGVLSKELINERLQVSFHKNNDKKTMIKSYNVKVTPQGSFSLNFDEFDGGVVNEAEGLQSGDIVLIRHKDEDGNEQKLIYQLEFEVELDHKGKKIKRKEIGKEHLYQYKRKVRCTRKYSSFKEVKRDMTLSYSNQPTAIFMIIPDYDSSNHALASIFTKQLYTELASNSVNTKGNKTFKRVHFILDEFGNMPPIDDMDQVMTVCLGRNILFTLVVQSFKQLKNKYGDASDVIKENCQNLIYILSKNEDTIEEVSKQAGEKTEINISSNQEHADLDHRITKSPDGQRLIHPTRLRQLIEGEQLIIRSLHRQDLKRKKVRPYPIFNTKETVMPYRFEFLSKWIDTSKGLEEIDIASEHTYLDLEDLNIDMSFFIRDEKQKIAFNKTKPNHTDDDLYSVLNKETENQVVKKEIRPMGEKSKILVLANNFLGFINKLDEKDREKQSVKDLEKYFVSIKERKKIINIPDNKFILFKRAIESNINHKQKEKHLNKLIDDWEKIKDDKNT